MAPGCPSFGSVVRTKPFRYAIAAPAFSVPAADRLLALLEGARWEHRAAEFYRFGIPCDDDLPRQVIELAGADGLFDRIRGAFEEAFMCRLDDCRAVELQRYGVGDGIGPHTDAACDEFRYVISLNSGWVAGDGGIWILSTASDLRGDAAYLPSINNSGFAFATGADTYHALSMRSEREAFGATFRFRKVDRR